MNANEVRVGKKVTIKVGKNEVEVTVIGKSERGWIVSTASGKSLSINNAERFIRSVDVEEKATKKPKAPAPQPPCNGIQVAKKFSMLDAAVQVLKAASQPMSAKEMIAAMEEADLWKSPAGKTPSNTLAAAINRECGQKENPRFKKSEKGKFALADNVHADSAPTVG